MLGRVFLPEEDEPGKPATVILGYGFWQRYFGGDQGVIGRTLTLNGNNSTVVGVMPADFSLNKEVMPAVNGIQNADLLVPLPLGERLAREPIAIEGYVPRSARELIIPMCGLSAPTISVR